MSQQKIFKTCEQFVLNVYKTFENQPLKLQIFTNLFLRDKRKTNKLVESQSKLAELVQDYPDLVDELNKLLPDEVKVTKSNFPVTSSREQEEEPVDMGLHKIFAELQARRPDKVQHIIELITSIKNNKNKKNNEILRDKLAKVLEDEPNLFNMFMRSLRKFFEETVPVNGHAEPEPEQEESVSEEPVTEIEEEIRDSKTSSRTRGTTGRGYGRRGGKGRRGGSRKVEAENGSPVVTPAIALPVTVRNELNLFENLRSSFSQSNYNQLMKIIYLYTECVIGANEVCLMVKPIFKGNDQYINLFHEIIFAREKTRRKNTTLFKPLGDIDFKKMNCQRNGSYSRLPESFPHMKSPINPKNPHCDAVLNKNWLSVPHGSEVNNFTIASKNTYEENLLKCEDERYEFDSSIYQYTVIIKWLDNLEEMNSKDAIHRTVDKILRMKIAHKACGNNEDLIEGFKKNPLKFAKKLSEKIQHKLSEIKETKMNQAKKKWNETSVENFHRSFDHRSFYFKQYEKKLTYHKNFLAEAIARHQDLNILRNNKNHTKYTGILNTFEGISNGIICNHVPLANSVLIPEMEEKIRFGKILPVYCMIFPNKAINQEIHEILTLKIQNFHANQIEKEKITRYLKVFLHEMLHLKFEDGEAYNVTIDEGKLLAIVARIQSKIFDKTFSFNTVKIEEAEKNYPGKTIDAAIDEGKRENTELKTEDTETPAEKNNNSKNSEVVNGTSQKVEEDISPKKKRKAEKKEVKQNTDSEESVNAKEMEFSMKDANNINMFEPVIKQDEFIFYGTQHLYYLVRFYYTLYERFLKIQEISSDFENNPNARLLTEEEKAEIAKERYLIFKWVLAHLIKNNIENEKFEDLMRCVYGNKAYLMFFIDKIVHMFIVNIQKLMNDDISVKTLNFFTESELPSKNSDLSKAKAALKKQRNWPEYVYLAHINELILENINCLQSTTFFRFVYSPSDCHIMINVYDSPYKNWNEKILETSCEYLEWYRVIHLSENSLATSNNPVFLKRNKEKNKKRLETEGIKIVQSNNLEWKYVPNTTKLVTDSFHKEDVFQVTDKNKKTADEEIASSIRQQFERLRRFKVSQSQAWRKRTLKSMGGK